MDDYKLALRTSQSERDSNRILTLETARRDFDRYVNPGSGHFGTRRILKSLGHGDDKLANRTDLPDGIERIGEHRAAANLHERLGYA